VNRWRNLLLLSLLAVCAASFWQARQGGPAGPPAGPSPDSEPEPIGAAAPRNVHRNVLNGTAESGLARRYSRDLPGLGCVVVAVGDAPHDSFATTLLVNRRLPAAAARHLAARLGGVPVVVEWDDRCPEDAVLVLGADHARRLAARAGPP
jgi:hypothetical protein